MLRSLKAFQDIDAMRSCVIGRTKNLLQAFCNVSKRFHLPNVVANKRVCVMDLVRQIVLASNKPLHVCMARESKNFNHGRLLLGKK